jgi:uncharacterized protein (UPF0248 family)
MVYQTLNKLKWTGRLDQAEIVITSRGSPGDRKTILGKQITQIKKSYFYFEGEGKETFIPLHRVLEIKLKGKTIWRKKI